MKALEKHHPFLYKLSTLMDQQYKFFGINFGWDFILGLIPFWGNLTTTGLSLFTIFYAAFYKVSASVLMRMLLNISVDLIITAIPVLGNLSDIFWQANMKNYKLFNDYLENPQKTVRRSIFVNILLLSIYMGLIVLCFYGLYKLATYIVSLF